MCMLFDHYLKWPTNDSIYITVHTHNTHIHTHTYNLITKVALRRNMGTRDHNVMIILCVHLVITDNHMNDNNVECFFVFRKLFGCESLFFLKAENFSKRIIFNYERNRTKNSIIVEKCGVGNCVDQLNRLLVIGFLQQIQTNNWNFCLLIIFLKKKQ